MEESIRKKRMLKMRDSISLVIILVIAIAALFVTDGIEEQRQHGREVQWRR